MAKVRSIFQPVYSEDRHQNEIASLIGAPADRVIMSVAFVRSEGVKQIALALSKNAARSEIYVGVRNGVTSVQGVNALLKSGAKIYAVDTGYGAAIFHPKFYCMTKGKKSSILIGSANLTFSGLNNNLEASALLELDQTDAGDSSFLARLVTGVEGLRKSFPSNCYRIKNGRHAIQMLNDGLLDDERFSRPDITPVASVRSKHAAKYVPKIGLKFKSLPKRSASKVAIKKIKQNASVAGQKNVIPAFGPLLWEKPSLPKGDLQLLTKGHASGVLRLTQAGFQIDGVTIDQTAYFRNEVFGGLAWTPGPKGKEVASAEFSIVIVGVDLGTFSLDISHKPSWEAGQGNYTTGLHWGEDAGSLIKKAQLVGRTLRLYGPTNTNLPFIIEID